MKECESSELSSWSKDLLMEELKYTNSLIPYYDKTCIWLMVLYSSFCYSLYSNDTLKNALGEYLGVFSAQLLSDFSFVILASIGNIAIWVITKTQKKRETYKRLLIEKIKDIESSID